VAVNRDPWVPGDPLQPLLNQDASGRHWARSRMLRVTPFQAVGCGGDRALPGADRGRRRRFGIGATARIGVWRSGRREQPSAGGAAAGNLALRTFHNPAGDSGAAPDIRSVVVRNADPSKPRRVSVAVRYELTGDNQSSLNAWFDTNLQNPGPEYRASVIPNSEGSSSVAGSGVGRDTSPAL
jgi:hypothetical protein